MVDPLDRRKLKRVAIPDTWVIYYKDDSLYRFGILLNISRSAVCFEIQDSLGIDTFLELEIIIPNKEKLILRGSDIREGESLFRAENTEIYYYKYAVVQFAPFGTDDRYNSLQILERLKSIEKEFLGKYKTLKIELSSLDNNSSSP
jgi:hypothetical protein